MIGELVTAVRAWRMRRHFGAVRLVVYQGLMGMLRAPGGALTYAAQFKLWRDRARARRQDVAGAYERIVGRLEQGLGLAESLRPFVPPEDYIVIFAGESSGRLAPTFESLIRSATAVPKMRRGIRQAYGDAIGALSSFLVLTFISGIMVWPSLMQSIPEQFWDGWALPMINGQIALTQHPWVLAIVFVIFGLYRWSLPTWTGKSRLLAERLLPPYAAYRDQQAATLLIVLAGLLRANLTLNQALDRIASQGTPYLRWHTRVIQRRELLYPGDAARILDSGVFSETMLDQIGNAAAARELAETVQHMGAETLDDVVDSVISSAKVGGLALLAAASLLITYYAAVQVIGSQLASDRLMKQIESGRVVRP